MSEAKSVSVPRQTLLDKLAEAQQEIADLREGWRRGVLQKEIHLLPETEAAVHIAELQDERDALQRNLDAAIAWADELRDRIRDIYLNTSREAMNRADVAGKEIASAEKECRLRHEAVLRPRDALDADA